MAAKTKAMSCSDELFMKLPPNPIYTDFQKIFHNCIPNLKNSLRKRTDIELKK